MENKNTEQEQQQALRNVNGFGLGVSATLLEPLILAQTIWWHYAKPVLSDSSFFVGGQ